MDSLQIIKFQRINNNLNFKQMNKNRCFFRKYVAILAFVLLAIVFQPGALFAQGAVVGYVSVNDVVTDAQLNRLTHIMAYNLFVTNIGGIIPNPGFLHRRSFFLMN